MALTNGLAIVGMSGGVDSAVAAALLLEEGWTVRGVSVRLWDSPRRDDRICSDHRDARRVADALGIPHETIDLREPFEDAVVTPFLAAYSEGRTPNPCVGCNREFKIGALLPWALERGAKCFATGHYARVVRSPKGSRLLRGSDPRRDQSYFLFGTRRAELDRLAFPIGGLTKDEVRSRARTLGLPVSDKADSQDLCFGRPADLLSARGLGGRPGSIVDEDGRTVGRHGGIGSYTIGQRKGLGSSGPEPRYVRAIDASSNTVRVGLSPAKSRGLRASAWHWTSEPASDTERLTVRVRSRHAGTFGTVAVRNGVGRVRFEEEVPSIAPGQAAVAYRGDEVVGGGWIEATE